jgi:tRNA pseudouridine13 synthase
MYKIKQAPEDFKVTEKIELHIDPEGDYAYFWLNKKGYATVKALQKIATFLGCRLKDIGFAGNKDKQAVTKQAISVKDFGKRTGEKRFDMFKSDDIKLEYIGRGKAPISLGDLKGNEFEIIIHDCEKAPEKITQFINYFDEQRFSKTNKEVGKAILKGDMKKACSLIDAEEVKNRLSEKPNDYVGAMKELPIKTRLMLVHSYQSYLWNETVKEYLQQKHEDTANVEYSLGLLVFPKKNIENVAVPIIGFGSEMEDKEMKAITDSIMKKESLNERDFVIRSMPELSAEGGKRDLVTEVKDLTIENIGEKSYKLKFFLQKGSYATMAVKRMMI